MPFSSEIDCNNWRAYIVALYLIHGQQPAAPNGVKKMSATTIKVVTTRVDWATGENAVINMIFTNQDKAWQFYAKAINHPGTVKVHAPDSCLKTYSNVDKALEALAFFAG